MNHKLYKIKTKYNKRFPPKTETVKSFCQDSKRQTVNPNIDKGEREKETEGGTEGCKSSCYTQCRGGGGGVNDMGIHSEFNSPSPCFSSLHLHLAIPRSHAPTDSTHEDRVGQRANR